MENCPLVGFELRPQILYVLFDVGESGERSPFTAAVLVVSVRNYYRDSVRVLVQTFVLHFKITNKNVKYIFLRTLYIIKSKCSFIRFSFNYVFVPLLF